MNGLPAVPRFLKAAFGGAFRDIATDVAVGTTPVRVVDHDAERTSLTLVNTGATIIYLHPTPGVSSASGVILAASGGTVNMNIQEDQILPSLEWWAVGSAAGGTLFALQVRRDVTYKDEGQ